MPLGGRRLYLRFEDGGAGELDLAPVDATYRADLHEPNELPFARFDARVEQRLAELKVDLVKWMFVLSAPTASR